MGRGKKELSSSQGNALKKKKEDIHTSIQFYPNEANFKRLEID
jgi:hypothetical protein